MHRRPAISSTLLSGLLLVLLPVWGCVPDRPDRLDFVEDPATTTEVTGAADRAAAGGSDEGPQREEDHLHEHDPGPEALGEVGRVEFPVSCGPEATAYFESGVAMFHSFWFPQADSAFQAALELDPECAMAEWGRAMAQMGNPYAGAIPEDRRSVAMAALDRARSLDPPTERERGFVEAARQLFGEGGDTDGDRRRSWERALEELHQTHPDDPEITIFLGLALLANAPPDDTTFVRQLRAADLLEPLFEQRPDHPGLAHYIIHAYDAPTLADRGLEAALSYAEIAPAAPHALHMPSHIFTRLGMWDRSIEANLASARASGNDWARVHPWDYLVYAYLQQGRDAEAARIVEAAEAAVSQAPSPEAAAGAYNWQAMPARLALEREDWAGAATLEIRGERAHQSVAIRHFARGVGMARTGDVQGARAERDRLAEIESALDDAGESYWARVVEAQGLAVEGWTLATEGRFDQALERMSAAAELEERVEKHPVTPGPLLPAREMHGEILLQAGRHGEALEAFQRVLEREPNRGRATYYAGRAAQALGDEVEAERYLRAYRELTARGDGTRGWTASNPR